MLKKDNLVNALKKYHLNGILQDIIFEVKDNELTTSKFKTETNIIGQITHKNVEMENCKVGVYFTGQFLKMLTILENDVKCKVMYGNSSTDDQVTSLDFSDNKGKSITFTTCEPDLVTSSYSKKAKVSDYEVKINLNGEIISDILKAESSIESAQVTFEKKKDKLFIIFGQSSNNTNRISFDVECEVLEDFDTLSFDSSSLKNILQVNADKFNIGTFEISSQGLLRIYFANDDFTAEYFLVNLETSN